MENAEQTQIKTEQPQNTLYVSYEDLDMTKLIFNPHATKTIPLNKEQKEAEARGEKITPTSYHEITMSYNFGNENMKKLKAFKFEGAEVRCSGGIKEQISQTTGKPGYSILIIYDNDDPEQVKMLDCKDKIYKACGVAIQSVRGAVGLPQFKAEFSEMCLFKPQTYIQKDPVTEEPLKDKSPTCFMKLFQFQTGQTLFTDPNGTPIDWGLLKDVDMRIIPVEHYRKIHIGAGRPSCVISLLSAVVTEIKAKERGQIQTYTMTKLKAARPELADTVAAQLAKLTADRQDLLIKDKEEEPNTDDTNSVNAPTFDGLGNTEVPLVSAIPPAASPTLPDITPVPTMADFTSGAPVRQTSPTPAPSVPSVPQVPQFTQAPAIPQIGGMSLNIN